MLAEPQLVTAEADDLGRRTQESSASRVGHVPAFEQQTSGFRCNDESGPAGCGEFLEQAALFDGRFDPSDLGLLGR